MEGTLPTEKMPPLEGVLNLRKATVADIPALLELEKSASESGTYFAGSENWEDELQNNSIYLIEKNGAAVGNVSYERKDDNHAYISDLVVDPRFRGRGIAREALVKLLEEFKDVKRIDLVTHPDNKVALGLYQSLGFVVESQKENYYGDGEPRLVLVLQK